MWGGYDDIIDLAESDEEEVEQHDDKEQAAAVKGVKCPKCDKTYQGGNVQRLRDHIAKEHSRDPDYLELESTVDKLFPPRNKTRKVECPECGKLIAGSVTNLKRHQGSRLCFRE